MQKDKEQQYLATDQIDDKENTSSFSTTESIGQKLKAQRLAHNFELDSIAKELHLPRRILEALENNEFNRHPGVIFMRGYLQNYARFLRLPSDSIMASFDGLELQNYSRPLVLPPRLFNKQPSFVQRSIRYITYLVFIVLLTLVVLWWRNNSNTVDNIIARSTASFSNSVTPTPASPKTQAVNNKPLASTHQDQQLSEDTNTTIMPPTLAAATAAILKQSVATTADNNNSHENVKVPVTIAVAEPDTTQVIATAETAAAKQTTKPLNHNINDAIATETIETATQANEINPAVDFQDENNNQAYQENTALSSDTANKKYRHHRHTSNTDIF